MDEKLTAVIQGVCGAAAGRLMFSFSREGTESSICIKPGVGEGTGYFFFKNKGLKSTIVGFTKVYERP